MSCKKVIDSLFAASVIPALDAFQGSGPLEGPNLQVDYRGVLVQAHPELKEHVQLTAGDDRNLLCLTTRGCCTEPFVFLLSRGLVDLCKSKPPISMCYPEWPTQVDVPKWMQPGKLLLLGHVWDPDPKGLTSLAGYVGCAEPYPEDNDLALGKFELSFSDPNHLLRLKRGAMEAKNAVSADISIPISGAFAWTIGEALRYLGPGDVELYQADCFHLWKFHEHSWAITSIGEEQKESVQ